MKNREKFRDEILEAIKEDNDENGKMCCFMKDNVIPRFVSEEDMELSTCGTLACRTCTKMFAFWLGEEYVEPPKPEVNWSKVPVDTLVRVRDNDDWVLQYFKRFIKGQSYPFSTWADGRTSNTAGAVTDIDVWKYCELAEEE